MEGRGTTERVLTRFGIPPWDPSARLEGPGQTRQPPQRRTGPRGRRRNPPPTRCELRLPESDAPASSPRCPHPAKPVRNRSIGPLLFPAYGPEITGILRQHVGSKQNRVLRLAQHEETIRSPGNAERRARKNQRFQIASAVEGVKVDRLPVRREHGDSAREHRDIARDRGRRRWGPSEPVAHTRESGHASRSPPQRPWPARPRVRHRNNIAPTRCPEYTAGPHQAGERGVGPWSA